MDWMDKAMVTSEISLLVQRMDQARGRIYWRSFSEKVHIPPLTFLNAAKVDDIYENRMGDRVGMYFSTWISHLKDTEFAVTARSLAWTPKGYKSGLGGKLVTGAKIVTAPVWKRLVQGGARTAGGSAHEKDMEAFYKFQKDGACLPACLLCVSACVSACVSFEVGVGGCGWRVSVQARPALDAMVSTNRPINQPTIQPTHSINQPTIQPINQPTHPQRIKPNTQATTTSGRTSCTRGATSSTACRSRRRATWSGSTSAAERRATSSSSRCVSGALWFVRVL
jgi:hypothetical protein